MIFQNINCKNISKFDKHKWTVRFTYLYGFFLSNFGYHNTLWFSPNSTLLMSEWFNTITKKKPVANQLCNWIQTLGQKLLPSSEIAKPLWALTIQVSLWALIFRIIDLQTVAKWSYLFILFSEHFEINAQHCFRVKEYSSINITFLIFYWKRA